MYKAEDVRRIITEKITGKWIAEHSVFGHFYRHVETNIQMPSITTINILDKPHLIPWSIKLAIEFLEKENRFERLKNPDERKDLITGAILEHKDVRDDAGTVGGKIHSLVEEWLNEWIDTGIKPGDIREYVEKKGEKDYRVWAGCRSVEAVFVKYKVMPIASEILVGIPKEGVGTLDLIVINDQGELELYDWKSSRGVNDYYAIQVSAYRQFFQKMTGLKIKRCRIFKIDKFSDKFTVYNIPSPHKAYYTFKNLSKVYNWLNNQQEKLETEKTVIKI